MANSESTSLKVLQRVLLTEAEAAAVLGYTPRMLQARRRRGNGPIFCRVGASSVRYRPEDLEAWARSLRRSSTEVSAISAMAG